LISLKGAVLFIPGPKRHAGFEPAREFHFRQMVQLVSRPTCHGCLKRDQGHHQKEFLLIERHWGFSPSRIRSVISNCFSAQCGFGLNTCEIPMRYRRESTANPRPAFSSWDVFKSMACQG